MKKSDTEGIGALFQSSHPSPRWGEGKVTLDSTPSPPSGERVVRRTADRVRGQLKCTRNSFTPSWVRGWVATDGENPPLRPYGSEAGFSLMEVLVAVAILGIVYATLFGLMSTSLKNVSRIEEREKVVRYGQMKLNELVVKAKQGEAGGALSGRLDDGHDWRASIEPYDSGENSDRTQAYIVAKIRLAVTWSGISRQNEYTLETLTWVPNVQRLHQ